ncbi:MAG: DUF4124 domain-containing protein [Geobacteraceae bacterium]|nr:DUF4124 domain-containing protein [Geobacteraceae bacterium]
MNNRTRCRLMLQVCFVMVSAVLLSVACHADMYTYVDAAGTVCMTNSMASVPKQYRASVTVVKEDTPAQRKLLPEVQKLNRDPAPEAASVKQSYGDARAPELQQTGADRRFTRTLLVVAGIIAGYFILSRIAATVGFPRAGSALFLLMVLLGGVYLYGLYISEMRSVFGKLRTDAQGIKKNVETREQKTDQTLQQIKEKE